MAHHQPGFLNSTKVCGNKSRKVLVKRCFTGILVAGINCLFDSYTKNPLRETRDEKEWEVKKEMKGKEQRD